MNKKCTDKRITAYCPHAKVRLIVADVTDSAKQLERAHLCGPVCGLLQGQAMAVAAIIAGEVDDHYQAISLRVAYPQGKIKGLIMECTKSGQLRGYTQVKVINELDDSAEPTNQIEEAALGKIAQCTVVRVNGKASTSAIFNVQQDDCAILADVLEGYYQQANQRRTISQIEALSEDGYLKSVKGVLLDFLPDATDQEYNRLQALFDQGILQTLLQSNPSIQDIANALGLDASIDEGQAPLHFECSCSDARILSMLHTLPMADLEALILQDKPASIFCHMCGKNYQIPVALMQQIKNERERNKQ